MKSNMSGLDKMCKRGTGGCVLAGASSFRPAAFEQLWATAAEMGFPASSSDSPSRSFPSSFSFETRMILHIETKARCELGLPWLIRFSYTGP